MTVDTTAQPAKLLVSFHGARGTDMATLFQGRGALVMADSGAFSAANSGARVTYEDYTAWVRRWQQTLFSYPCLDVIGDPEATWANYQRMRREGLAPLPVYHYRSPLRYLQRYLDAGERYVALGGMVRAAGAEIKRWIVTCFKLAEPYGAVFHGFGRTRQPDLRDFPWYSVDSTSFSVGIRYGNLDLFDGWRFIRLHRSQPKSLYRHGALLRAHGVTPADMDNRNPRVRELGYRVCTVSWRRYEEWMRRHHGPVPGVRPGDPPGPHLFLAEYRYDNVARVLRAVQYAPGPYFPQPSGVGARGVAS